MMKARDDCKTLGSVVAGVSVDDAVVYGVLILAIVGSIAPWATSPLSSASGFDGDGKWTALIALLAAGALATGRRVFAALCCAAIAAVGVYDAIHIHHAAEKIVLGGVQLDHVGWGVYLTAAAGVVALVAMLWRRQP